MNVSALTKVSATELPLNPSKRGRGSQNSGIFGDLRNIRIGARSQGNSTIESVEGM